MPSTALKSALHMAGSYIITSARRDGMFYIPEMSRPAGVIELWATLKYSGKNGIDEMIYVIHQRAVQFSKEIRKRDGFAVLNEIVFNQVIVTCKTDALAENVMARIQEFRECWVGGSAWNGKKVIRVSVCSWVTTAADISRSVDSFSKAFQEVSKASEHIDITS